MNRATFQQERKLWENGYKYVVGLDEVGRGAICGPVVAGAVAVATAKFKNLKLRDSKKLSPKAREKFYKILTKHPGIEWGIGKVSERMIDKINIKNAAELAMEKALKNLEKKIKKRADFLIIDGNHIRNLQLTTYNLKLLIKADEKVFSCAAASIIAKVTRDRTMKRYHRRYKSYGFDRHKGYLTRFHEKALLKHGPCPIHRKSFLPIKNMVK